MPKSLKLLVIMLCAGFSFSCKDPKCKDKQKYLEIIRRADNYYNLYSETSQYCTKNNAEIVNLYKGAICYCNNEFEPYIKIVSLSNKCGNTDEIKLYASILYDKFGADDTALPLLIDIYLSEKNNTEALEWINRYLDGKEAEDFKESKFYPMYKQYFDLKKNLEENQEGVNRDSHH